MRKILLYGEEIEVHDKLVSVEFVKNRYGNYSDPVIMEIENKFQSMSCDIAVMGESMHPDSRKKWAKLDAMDTISDSLVELGYEGGEISDFISKHRERLSQIAWTCSGIDEFRYKYKEDVA